MSAPQVLHHGGENDPLHPDCSGWNRIREGKLLSPLSKFTRGAGRKQTKSQSKLRQEDEHTLPPSVDATRNSKKQVTMGAKPSVERKLSDDQPAEEELVLNELKVETGDQNAVKNMLDDAIHEYFEDKTEYTVSYGWDNMKLLLMVFATLTAAASHFFKTSAISERVLIYSCVGTFFFIHALLLGYSLLVEKDIILRLTKKGEKSPVILVRTDFPYAEENYTICLQYEGQSEKQVKVELYVGRFFDKEGYFSKDALVKDLKAVVSRFQKVKKQ